MAQLNDILATKTATRPDKSGLKKVSASQRPFSRINYIMMGACLVLIILGFVLMSGPGSSVEGGFNPDIFSTRRIVVGPLLSFLGFLLMAPAILYSPASRRTEEENPSAQND
ncbi:MAG: DUF3098 domain-containing protein [Muribaculum sp.]|nr:DUF3098 domain-containing protein [Muribaculum sp.]